MLSSDLTLVLCHVESVLFAHFIIKLMDSVLILATSYEGRLLALRLADKL